MLQWEIINILWIKGKKENLNKEIEIWDIEPNRNYRTESTLTEIKTHYISLTVDSTWKWKE